MLREDLARSKLSSLPPAADRAVRGPPFGEQDFLSRGKMAEGLEVGEFVLNRALAQARRQSNMDQWRVPLREQLQVPCSTGAFPVALGGGGGGRARDRIIAFPAA